MHKRTESFIEYERRRIENAGDNFFNKGPEDLAKERYLKERDNKFGAVNDGCQERDNGEEDLADYIIEEMKMYKMTLVEACIILGYIKKKLKINDVYRSGIDIEGFYIDKCLRKELIRLAKEIADYIQNQEEIYANIPTTLGITYGKIIRKSSEINIWQNEC